MKTGKTKVVSLEKSDIYGLLKKDHRKVEELLDRLVKASEMDDDQWKGLIDEIRDELIPHARAEEELFYNPLREKSKTGSKRVMHGYTEHAMAETDLRTLQAAKAIDVNWIKLAKKLRKDVLHHVEEEEGKIFEAAKKVFSKEEAQKIGTAFEKLKPSIKKQSFAATTMQLVSNLMPQSRAKKAQRGSEKMKKSA